MTIRELLSDKSKWVQHEFAVDATGQTIDPRDKSATRYCLLGAVEKVYGSWFSDGEAREIYAKLMTAIDHFYPNTYEKVGHFNDNPNTEFEDVQRVIEKAGV